MDEIDICYIKIVITSVGSGLISDTYTSLLSRLQSSLFEARLHLSEMHPDTKED